jgi:hypothetical protein
MSKGVDLDLQGQGMTWLYGVSQGMPWLYATGGIMRREGDSNPRYPLGVHTLSRRAPSTTRSPLQNKTASGTETGGENTKKATGLGLLAEFPCQVLLHYFGHP